MIINPQFGNVFQIQVQWLGYGNVIFSVENPATGRFINFHTIQYPNTSTTPSLAFPSFYCFASVTNAVATNITLRVACMTIYTEGNSPLTRPGIRFSASTTAGFNINVVSTNTSLLSIYNKPTNVLGGVNTNYTPITIDQMSLASNGSVPIRYQLIRNTTGGVTGGTAWTDVSTSTSVMAFSTTNVAVTGGTVIMTFYLTNISSLNQILNNLVIQLFPGQWLVVAGLTTSASTNDNYAALSWREFF